MMEVEKSAALLAAEQADGTRSGGDGATDQEPHGTVSGIAGHGARNIGTDGVGGIETVDEQDDAGDEEDGGKYFIHGRRMKRSAAPGKEAARCFFKSRGANAGSALHRHVVADRLHAAHI